MDRVNNTIENVNKGYATTQETYQRKETLKDVGEVYQELPAEWDVPRFFLHSDQLEIFWNTQLFVPGWFHKDFKSRR